MKKIKFSIQEDLKDVFPEPKESIKKAPSFYKNMKPQTGFSPQTSTVKRCVPFLDALSSGFIIPLWSDLYVKAEEDNFHIEFPQDLPLNSSIENHNYLQLQEHPFSQEPYGKLAMKFMNPWIIETPPGYSALFTSPFNHLEKRFKILDGVVDTDNYYNNINFPFLWTGGEGEFFIEKGTPLVQIFPFKRDNFSSEINIIDEKKQKRTRNLIGTYLKDAYKKLFWHKSIEK